MSQQYVYVRSEPDLWTVGFYDPEGKWHSESDHETTEKAAARVNYMNGGSMEWLNQALNEVYRP